MSLYTKAFPRPSSIEKEELNEPMKEAFAMYSEREENDATPRPSDFRAQLDGSALAFRSDSVATVTPEQSAPETIPNGNGGKESNGHFEHQPLEALSSTLSASSSLSGSTKHVGDSPPMSSSRFKHYIKPTVLDSPDLVVQCQKYIDEKNIDGLARIARNSGLPPAFRQYAWPLLLSKHPHVLNPNIVPEHPTNVGASDDDFDEDDDDDEERMVRQKDLVPLKRIEKEMDRIRQKRSNNSPSNTKITASNVISHQQSAKSTPGTTSPASSVTSQANGSASSSSSSPDHTEDKMGQAINQYFSDNMESDRYEAIKFAIVNFLQKWGRYIPYERAMAYAACDLSEWVDPIYEMSQALKNGSSVGSTPDLTPVQSWENSQTQVEAFDKVFEQLMLMMLSVPYPTSNGPAGPCDSPYVERISDFLSALRNCEPGLAKHFDEEDVWTVGGEDWMVYWIKWVGTRVWKKEERARFWDMYMGWRPDHDQVSATNSKDIDAESAAGIGSYKFWNPKNLDSTKILDWHTQHVFICVALLKAHRNVLLELDQSEIRQFLMNFGKNKELEGIVEEAAELWRSWHWHENDDMRDYEDEMHDKSA